MGIRVVIVSRARVDIIKSGGYKLSTPEIELEILRLPYIAKAMVVGVEDEEFGQRVGAVVALDRQRRENSITIDRLRKDLRSKLPGYKLPTVLRIVNGELSKGPTGNVQKKVRESEYFPVPG